MVMVNKVCDINGTQVQNGTLRQSQFMTIFKFFIILVVLVKTNVHRDIEILTEQNF